MRLIGVLGPTASGKTGLAIALARALGTEIISCDSMQIYKGLDIATAKPDASEQQGIPHHMLDVIGPTESYSVSQYAAQAHACAQAMIERGKIPIVCGGTGLYLDALISGNPFERGEDDALRQKLGNLWEEDGGQALYRQLMDVDPESAQKLHPNDKKRVVRALEIYTLTGRTKSSFDEESKMLKPRYDAILIGLLPQPRGYLYERIDRRVDRMEELGLIDEARRVFQIEGLSKTAAQAIGYKELFLYFEGAASKEQALDLIRQRSRNYAKRQLTWFLRDERIHWITYSEKENDLEVLSKSTNLLRKLGIEL